jgi:hypothetical protein
MCKVVRCCNYVLILLFLLVSLAHADNTAFDLAGPKINVRVQRGGKELPIGQVPNLLPGDRLWIHADLPESQSAHYLMVVAFLRGATNPPPEKWFTCVETWKKPLRQEGVMVNVPDEAQQALIFLAPETGGDFSTLRSTVRGKPGAFVRAAQDLVQASLDRARLERYLNLVREASRQDSGDLQTRTNLLARSLSIKVDQSCFEKPTAQQLQCLTQNGSQLVLDDEHTQSMVAMLTSGTPADLLTQITNTPHMPGSTFDPYVGAVVDVVRILGSAHTAKYQYIPALALPEGDSLNLKLNNPPSFRDPKSVIVVGLPPIGRSTPPPLRPVDAKQVQCAQKPDLVLSADGAPLIFGTDLGHDFTLSVRDDSGKELQLPAKPDATQGGFVIDNAAVRSAALPLHQTATLHGYWGFEAVKGPAYMLRNSRSGNWTTDQAGANGLIVGRDDTLELQSPEAVCVESVTAKNATGKHIDSTWKAAKPDSIQVKLALQDAQPGPVAVEINRYGAAKPDVVSLQSYAESARLDSFTMHAGDTAGVLSGTRLDEVAALELSGVRFSPEDLSRDNQRDQLTMKATSTASLKPGQDLSAQVTLKDDRSFSVKANVASPRPQIALIGKTAEAGGNSSTSDEARIQLDSSNEMAQDQMLRFALKSVTPEKFTPGEKIEVATQDEVFRTSLTTGNGTLTLQDPQTMLAVLKPLKDLGASAFGQLKFRAVDDSGVAGDWQSLVTVVRVPTLAEVRCTGKPQKQCTLLGDNLFLLDSVSTDPQFTNAVQVPEGFVDSKLAIPQAPGKMLYIKLRDDPSSVNTAAVPVVNESESAGGEGEASVRH